MVQNYEGKLHWLLRTVRAVLPLARCFQSVTGKYVKLLNPLRESVFFANVFNPTVFLWTVDTLLLAVELPQQIIPSHIMECNYTK
jgi:hypothetical protein